MSLTTPSLIEVLPIDNSQPFTFTFLSTGGNQVTKNNLVIENNSTGVEIYNQTIDNFIFNHTIPANTLTNGTQYRAKIRTGDINGNWSNFSDYILFYCFPKPIVNITNIIDGLVTNQTYEVLGLYSSDYDPIQSYRFLIYDENSILLYTTPEVYSSDIKHTFVFDHMKTYGIELKCISQNKVEVSSGIIEFIVQYIQPELNTGITLEMFNNTGEVKITSTIVQVVGEGQNYLFVDSDWVDITASNAIVSFQDGLNWDSINWALKLRFKNIPYNKVFCKVLGTNGTIEVLYRDNRFHAYRYSSNLVSHFINSPDITFLSEDTIILDIRHINGLIDLFVEKVVV